MCCFDNNLSTIVRLQIILQSVRSLWTRHRKVLR